MEDNETASACKEEKTDVLKHNLKWDI